MPAARARLPVNIKAQLNEKTIRNAPQRRWCLVFLFISYPKVKTLSARSQHQTVSQAPHFLCSRYCAVHPPGCQEFTQLLGFRLIVVHFRLGPDHGSISFGAGFVA